MLKDRTGGEANLEKAQKMADALANKPNQQANLLIDVAQVLLDTGQTSKARKLLDAAEKIDLLTTRKPIEYFAKKFVNKHLLEMTLSIRHSSNEGTLRILQSRVLKFELKTLQPRLRLAH